MPVLTTGAGAFPVIGGGGGGFSLTFTDTKTNSAGGSAITYNSGGDPSIGTADANRVVAVAIAARVNTTFTVSSVTIAGVSATQVSGAAATPGSSVCTDIWYAAVPSGTTATVVVTYAGTSVVSGIAVYRIITTTAAPSAGQNDFDVAFNNASSPLSRAITIPSGGGMIGSFIYSPASGSNTTTWAGGTITKDVDVNINSTGRFFSAANDVTDSGATTIETSVTGTAAVPAAMSLAAWGT